MTFTKLLDRLVTFGPPLIAPHCGRPNHCIFSTAVAVDVLRAFHETVAPLSVRLVLMNRAYVEGQRRGDDDHVILGDGGWVLDSGADPDEPATNADRTLWHGHLVAWLPLRRVLVDLNHGQFNRPEKAIRVEDAVALPFQAAPEPALFNHAGMRLAIAPRPDDRAWMDARDWTADRRDVVAAVLRAVRKGRV